MTSSCHKCPNVCLLTNFWLQIVDDFLWGFPLFTFFTLLFCFGILEILCATPYLHYVNRYIYGIRHPE